MEATGVCSYFFSGMSHIVCLELDELEDFSKLDELMFGFEADVDDVFFSSLELSSLFKDDSDSSELGSEAF